MNTLKEESLHPSNPLQHLLELQGERRPWVLVAEDDHELLRLLVRSLTRDGYEVVAVGSGLDLFDQLRVARIEDHLPALIVSDVRMPGLTGIQVIRTMNSWGLTLPVIFITAFPDDETLAEAKEEGAAAILSKPFDMDDLRTAVLYLLERPERAMPLSRLPPL